MKYRLQILTVEGNVFSEVTCNELEFLNHVESLAKGYDGDNARYAYQQWDDVLQRWCRVIGSTRG